MRKHRRLAFAIPLLFAPLLATACGDAFVATGGAGGATTTTSAGGDTTPTSGGTGGSSGSTGTGGSTGCTTSSDCGPNEECSADGTCVCLPGATDCGAGCVDVQTDRKNCGGCGVLCGTKCVAGSCDDPVSVAAGGQVSCAVLAQGEVYCWGKNNVGQLGSAGPSSGKPVKVPGLPKMKAVFVGKSFEATHVCAVSVDGALYCWGSNQAGKLGIGDDSNDPKPPTKVTALDAVQSVGLGGQHSVASVDPTVFGWGANDQEQLGYSGIPGANSPDSGSLVKGINVVAGGDHACAVTEVGLICWGRNAEGQVGSGDNVTPAGLTVIALEPPGIKQVAAGENHTCALLSADGAVYCWGANAEGQLGLGGLSPWSPPGEPVPLVDGVYTNAIAAGMAHTAAIAGGDVYAWGRNAMGQVDPTQGDPLPIPSPVKVAGVSDATALALGMQHSCALEQKDKTARVVCWGGNAEGQVGKGALGGDHLTPTPVQFP